MKVRRMAGCMVLALSLMAGVIGTATPKKAEAATTKKYVMIKGEKDTVSILFIGALKWAKSSKPSVVKVKKKGSNQLVLTAKKAGKATISCRGKYGYGKYIITVKNRKLGLKYKGANIEPYIGYAFYEVTNKCGDYLSSVELTYDILDAAGNVLKTATETMFGLVPNAKNYIKISVSSYLSLGASAIKVKSYKAKHSMTLKYKNYTKKIKASYSSSKKAVTFTNKTKKSVLAKADVVYYDAAGNIVDVQTVSASLSAKGKDTRSVSSSKDYATVKLFKKAYA